MDTMCQMLFEEWGKLHNFETADQHSNQQDENANLPTLCWSVIPVFWIKGMQRSGSERKIF